MPIIKIDNDTFEKEVLQSECLVIVNCYASWAGSCSILYNTLASIINQYEDCIKITTIDVGNNKAFAKKLNIKLVPTMLFYKDGTLVDRLFGALSRSIIIDKINRYAD